MENIVQKENAKPMIFLFPTEFGTLIMPEHRADQINNCFVTFNAPNSVNNMGSWGDFKKKISNNEIYNYCFKTQFDQPRFRSHLLFIAEPTNKQNQPSYNHWVDENRRFDLDISIYLKALQIYTGFGNDADEWMPSEIRQQWGDALYPISLSKDIYFFRDTPKLMAFVRLLSKLEYSFVLFSQRPILFSAYYSRQENESYFVPDIAREFLLNQNVDFSWDGKFEEEFGYHMVIYRINWTGDKCSLPLDIREKHQLEENVIFAKNNNEIEEFIKDVKESEFVVKRCNYGIDELNIITWERHWQDESFAEKYNLDYQLETRDIPLVYHSPREYLDFKKNEIFIDQKWTIQKIERTLQSEAHLIAMNLFPAEEFRSSFLEFFRMHGYYSATFFYRKYYSLFTKRMIEKPILDKKILHQLSLGYPDIPFDFEPNIGYSAHVLVSYLIDLYEYEIFMDTKLKLEAQQWVHKNRILRNCSYCGKLFSPLTLPEWLYTANGINDCCFLCRIMEFPMKDNALERIRDFVKVCGFIPNTNDGLSKYTFMSQIPPERYREVIFSYARMGRQKHIGYIFGSWFEGLVYSGSLPNNALITKRGIKCIASDGHVCLSLAELRIDEWLTSHNIPHEREPYYPPHPLHNPKGLKRGDWKIGDTIVEYFGLTGDKSYDEGTEIKFSLIQDTKIPFIPIFPSELANLDLLIGTQLFFRNQESNIKLKSSLTEDSKNVNHGRKLSDNEQTELFPES